MIGVFVWRQPVLTANNSFAAVIRTALLGLLVAAVTLSGAVASADKPKKRKKAAAAAVVQAPSSEAVGKALAPLKWGMTKQEVLAHFVKNIEEKYKKPLSEATDAITEDRLRHEMGEQVAQIRGTLVKFDGTTTGWDVSFLRPEFTHHNDEEMFVVRDENSQNFYFFIQGKLWKWYKAFDAEVFAGQPFEEFAAALQGRYGKAADRQGKLGPRGEEKRWLEWQSKSTRLRAIDENRFYGFYCLVFESNDTLVKLAALRAHQDAAQGGGPSLVDSVMTDEAATTANEDVVDRVTGKIRNRKDAPKEEKKAPK